ncbi:hypothetical protein BaRGS_00036186 [Batillaria attramentaria]|uniref:Uncharacterized protein n=1 Tax=Batillaria attramentaria TaxID=370345 RepID=A0ABD0JCC3_9CAEN
MLEKHPGMVTNNLGGPTTDPTNHAANVSPLTATRFALNLGELLWRVGLGFTQLLSVTGGCVEKTQCKEERLVGASPLASNGPATEVTGEGVLFCTEPNRVWLVAEAQRACTRRHAQN